MVPVHDDGRRYRLGRVTASNQKGEATLTQTVIVTNGPSAAPAAPALLDPPDNANLTGTAVTLRWSQAARAYDYRVRMYAKQYSDRVVLDTIIGRENNGIHSTQLSLGPITIDKVANGLEYAWDVQARNSMGTASSARRNFSFAPPCDTPALGFGWATYDVMPSFPGCYDVESDRYWMWAKLEHHADIDHARFSARGI
jgi:hypothetical protein